MGDMREVFDAMREHDKERRDRNLARAQSKSDGWTQHTEYHWSRTLQGTRLDYWPSRNKFMHKGKIMVGDVHGYVAKREKNNADSSIS